MGYRTVSRNRADWLFEWLLWELLWRCSNVQCVPLWAVAISCLIMRRLIPIVIVFEREGSFGRHSTLCLRAWQEAAMRSELSSFAVFAPLLVYLNFQILCGLELFLQQS